MTDVLLDVREMEIFGRRLHDRSAGRLSVTETPITRNQARAIWSAARAFTVEIDAPPRPTVPRGPYYGRHVAGAAISAGALALTGCATLGGNVKGQFACRAPDGICAPTSKIDDQALAMIAGDTGPTPAGMIDPGERGEPRMTPVAGQAVPPRTTEKVLRIVFPAHVDQYGRFREASAIHAVVERSAWLASAERDQLPVSSGLGSQALSLGATPSLTELASASPEVGFPEQVAETTPAMAAAPATTVAPSVAGPRPGSPVAALSHSRRVHHVRMAASTTHKRSAAAVPGAVRVALASSPLPAKTAVPVVMLTSTRAGTHKRDSQSGANVIHRLD